MGKFRSKLKGQTKGKRWPKGQSSSSNPETHKYRDKAKSSFFQETVGSSALTVTSLKKHDAQQFQVKPSQVLMDAESEIDSQSSVASFSGTYQSTQSFASEWSDCSNMSFGKFMKTFQASSSLHKEMLAILAAITEVIRQNGGTESSIEYFCTLVTTLETIYNSDPRNEDQVTAVLALLNMGIKTVPEPVLQKLFSETSLKMMHVLNDYSSSENNIIIRSTLGVLATLLRTQELAVWNISSTKEIFNAILSSFSIHPKPKWRKAAQNAVFSIVKASCFCQEGVNNPAADRVAEFCEQILEACMGGGSNKVLLSSIESGQTTILHTLGLLKETIFTFSKSHIKKTCELILRLMTLNYPLVTSCGLQVLHSLFSAQDAVIPAELNAKLIQALFEYQPAATDVHPTLAWLLVMQQAHIHLCNIDISVGCIALPKIISATSQLWLSGKPQVSNATTHTLEILLRDALSPACQTKEHCNQFKSKIEKCVNIIHSCLSYQYNTVWNQVLHVIGVMFEICGPNCNELLKETLKSMAELRDSYNFSFNSELEHAIGAAIRHIGPEQVLNVISLRKENGDLNIERSWLLPVLKENIKFSTLNYFRENIFPLARFCLQKSQELAQQNNGIGAHSSELLYLQLWNLLPCFCNYPTDIKSEFKNMAKLLGTAISDRKELRLAVMASLRKLISSAKENKDNSDIKEISRFDKNYLPILFNVYTTKPIGSDEEGQRLAALDTIKVYLTISKQELNQQLFNNALERLNSSSDEPEDSFIKESILDLIRVLVPYQTVEGISKLFEQCVKSLPKIKSNKEQKKAYRILEQICSSETDGCQLFLKRFSKTIQNLLMQCLKTTAVSSKGARLRCLNYLVKSRTDLTASNKLIPTVISEAVLCCKDVNVKCRQTAYSLLNTIGEILMSKNEMQQFTECLVAGLGGTPQVISCTVLALASVLHNFSGALGQENIQLILENVSILAGCPTREIVSSCLSFIKVFCSALPILIVAGFLKTIFQGLCNMTDDCKRHFRLKVRDILDKLIRKHGADSISPFIPESDTVMFKKFRNLRKLNARKKRLKEASLKEKDSSSDEEFTVKARPKSVDEILADLDSDDDLNDMETDQPKLKKKQVNTWIKEDADTIIDFTDPTVTSKISATKPGQVPTKMAKTKEKSKTTDFKTAPDGRIIIKDTSDSSGDEKGKKTSKLNFYSDSEDSDDVKSIAETLPLSDRKRKKSSSVKSGFSTLSSGHLPNKYKPGGSGIHRPTNSAASIKSAKTDLGSDYRSKKAKGDFKKKGKKFDPYAYLPLQRTTLNKRKKAKAAGQFKNIVKAAKAGALKGVKAKRKGSV